MFSGMEDDVESISTASIISSGFGAAINCMLPLVNVADERWDGTEAYRLTTSGVSSNSPGMGASTIMTGRRFAAGNRSNPSANCMPAMERTISMGVPCTTLYRSMSIMSWPTN